MEDQAASDYDVVVVGGGIGGGSLATALAREGQRVLVLEATAEFVDKIRGESMMPWGVAEAERLGVAAVLRAAGAHVAPTWLRYYEGIDEPTVLPVGLLVPDVPGTLNLHHPTACQALLDAAAAAGAEIRRGITNVRPAADGAPWVRFEEGGAAHTVRAKVVVGADGRASAMRQALGVELDALDPTVVIVGLFLEGVEGASDSDLVLEHDRGMSLLINQDQGRARAYHVVPIEDRARYSGPSGADTFLADLRAARDGLAEMFVAVRPAGPCGGFPNVESWTDRPFLGSTVLIGDAAGTSDPTAGCGLSVTMRDARVVRDLILGGAATAEDFAAYGAARAALLARLRLIAGTLVHGVVAPGADASARTARRVWCRDAMAAMDPALFPILVSMFAGPDTMPDELLEHGIPAQLVSA